MSEITPHGSPAMIEFRATGKKRTSLGQSTCVES
jgi:hypothetical protein